MFQKKRVVVKPVVRKNIKRQVYKSRNVKLKDFKSKDFQVQQSLVHFNNLMKQPLRVYSPTVIMTPTTLDTVAPETIKEGPRILKFSNYDTSVISIMPDPQIIQMDELADKFKNI